MARADAGLTISQLAEKAGVSRDTISKAEKGRHNLQAGTLSKVARALGMTASELLAEEESHIPKAFAQPSETEPEAARDHTPWDRRQSVIKAARDRTPWDRLRGFIEGAEATCAHWEARLDDKDGLSNDEVISLASFDWTLTLALEMLTDDERRDLRNQYPDVDNVRPLSRLEPVRHRWAGVMIRVSHLRLKHYPKPEDRQMYREGREEMKRLVDSEHAQQ